MPSFDWMMLLREYIKKCSSNERAAIIWVTFRNVNFDTEPHPLKQLLKFDNPRPFVLILVVWRTFYYCYEIIINLPFTFCRCLRSTSKNGTLVFNVRSKNPACCAVSNSPFCVNSTNASAASGPSARTAAHRKYSSTSSNSRNNRTAAARSVCRNSEKWMNS